MAVDNRCKECPNKCKDCKFAKRADRWNIRCYHEQWKDGPWGGKSPLMGNSTMGCEKFERK